MLRLFEAILDPVPGGKWKWKSPMDISAHVEAEVTLRRDLTPDLWVLRVRPDQPLAFRPGQFATLGLPDGRKMVERAYSIASSPAEPELEFFLERVPQGALSQRLHALGSGERLFLRRVARGNFLLDEESGHDTHLMIATVTGVAPFVSMLRSLRRAEESGRRFAGRRVFLLQGASHSREFGYEGELARLEGETDWFRYVPAVSRPWEDAAWARERGRLPGLLPTLVERFGIDAAQTTAYLCGNPDMIAAGREVLEGAGFSKDSLREERYWAPESSP
jgi:ferredoxin/flavodoxin---NADP+ reductase